MVSSYEYGKERMSNKAGGFHSAEDSCCGLVGMYQHTRLHFHNPEDHNMDRINLTYLKGTEFLD
jgi:hypothetical protein